MSKTLSVKELFEALKAQGFDIKATTTGWMVGNPARSDAGLVAIHTSSLTADANRGYKNTIAELKRIGFEMPSGSAHKCPDCPRSFKTVQALGAHRYRQHGYRSPDYEKAKAERDARKARQAQVRVEAPAPAKAPEPRKAPEPKAEKEAPKPMPPAARAMALETALSSALEQAAASAHELVLLVEGARTLQAGFDTLREEHKALEAKHEALLKRLEGVLDSL